MSKKKVQSASKGMQRKIKNGANSFVIVIDSKDTLQKYRAEPIGKLDQFKWPDLNHLNKSIKFSYSHSLGSRPSYIFHSRFASLWEHTIKNATANKFAV